MHEGYCSHSCLSFTTVTASYFIYGLKARCRWASLGNFNKINVWNFLKTLRLEVIASRSTSLCEELWMYKSNSDGFFSTIVVYRPKIITILLKVECFLN